MPVNAAIKVFLFSFPNWQGKGHSLECRLLKKCGPIKSVTKVGTLRQTSFAKLEKRL